jgi:cobalt-zinc-cadmium efflux system membrane fusion protein
MKSLFTLTLIASLAFAAPDDRAQSAQPPEPTANAAKPAGDVVTLTKENLALVSLKTETMARGSLAMTLKAVGRISENLNKTAKVTTTLEGRLIKLNCDLNDRVTAGEVVGLVQTPELLGKPLELKAPIDGVIVERKSTVGELITRETEVYTISDPTDLWLLAEIKERDLGAVRVGQEASFTVLAYPGETFRGKIVLVGNRVEPETRTLEVRIAASNPDGRLKPGMFADVEVATTALRDVLTVSDEALQTMDNQTVVFVALDATRFEKRVVQTGLEQRGRVQIVDGLAAGEHVVTEGSFILKSELLKGELGEE